MSYNTIILKGELGRRYEEKVADGANTPGMMLEVTSASKWKAHQVRGGRWTRAVSIENALQGPDLVNTAGNSISDAYADATVVRGVYLEPGDVFNALLHAGESVSKGDWAVGYGDGTVAKAATAFLANIVAPSTTLTSWTTEVAFSNGTVTIPKNTLKVGDIIRIKVDVSILAANSTDTVLLKLKLGTTALIATSALNITTGDIGQMEFSLIVRTIGATGTVFGVGSFVYGTAGTAVATPVELVSTTVDTTADQTLTVTATCSVSNAGNQAQLNALIVEQVRAGSSAENGSGGGAIIGTFDDTVDNSAGGSSVRIPVLVA